MRFGLLPAASMIVGFPITIAMTVNLRNSTLDFGP
jgi:hypothetical protein